MHRNASIFDNDYVASPDPLRHAAATVCEKLAQTCRNEHTEFALDGSLASIATWCGHATDLKLTPGARDETAAEAGPVDLDCRRAAPVEVAL